MKRSLERALIDNECELATLKHNASKCIQETTTYHTEPEVGCLVHPRKGDNTQTLCRRVTIDVCNSYFNHVLYDHVLGYIFPLQLLEDNRKARLVCNTTYSAFCVLVCVEGLPEGTELSVVFPLLIWLTEVALGTFYNAKDIKDIHEGHMLALWDVIRYVAYKPKEEDEHPPEIQKTARTLVRESEDPQFDKTAASKLMFQYAKSVANMSTSLNLVLNAG